MAAPFIPMRGMVNRPMGVPTLGAGVAGATLVAGVVVVVAGVVVPDVDGVDVVVAVAPSFCWSS